MVFLPARSPSIYPSFVYPEYPGQRFCMPGRSLKSPWDSYIAITIYIGTVHSLNSRNLTAILIYQAPQRIVPMSYCRLETQLPTYVEYCTLVGVYSAGSFKNPRTGADRRPYLYRIMCALSWLRGDSASCNTPRRQY